MSINLLKKIIEKLPNFIKIYFGSLIRYGLISNPVFKRQYFKLLEMENWEKEKINSFQVAELKDLLIFSYENTKYYKELFDENEFNPYKVQKLNDIEKLPVLTRDILIERQDDISVENIKNYYQVATGGSSGKALNLLMEKDAIFKERAFVYHFWKKAGYDYRHSKIATFRGVEFKGAMFKYNPMYNEMMFNPFILSDENIVHYVKKLNDFGATFIYGYPSAISNFCELLKKHNLTLNEPIQAVLLVSENVYDHQKEKIENILHCKSYAFYGHTERAVFAEQEGEGYIFNPFYGITELGNTSKGNIICTGFLNRKMPLIRYELDDYAQLKNDNIYEITGHRNQEVLIGKNNEIISMAAMEFHSDVFEKIVAYQFVQSEKGKVVFRVQSNEILLAKEINKIDMALSKKIGSVIEYKIIIVPSVELTGRGKYKMIIQKYKVSQ